MIKDALWTKLVKYASHTVPHLSRLLTVLLSRINYKDPLGKERTWEAAERSVSLPPNSGLQTESPAPKFAPQALLRQPCAQSPKLHLPSLSPRPILITLKPQLTSPSLLPDSPHHLFSRRRRHRRHPLAPSKWALSPPTEAIPAAHK